MPASDLEVLTLPLPPLETNAYLLIDSSRRAAFLVDAPPMAHQVVRQVLEEQGGLVLEGLFLTHGHWDHIADAPAFAAEGVAVFAHEADRPFLDAPSRMAAFAPPGLELKPVAVTRWLADGETVEVLGRPATVRHVPGHSPGSLMLHLAEVEAAFVGDLVFQGSVGRTDLPLASFASLEDSIRRHVFTLPDDTVLLPGHGEPTSAGGERRDNPYVRP